MCEAALAQIVDRGLKLEDLWDVDSLVRLYCHFDGHRLRRAGDFHFGRERLLEESREGLHALTARLILFAQVLWMAPSLIAFEPIPARHASLARWGSGLWRTSLALGR